MHDEGLSRTGSLLDTAVNKEIIQKSGTWFSFGNEKLGQGREAARIYLKENPKLVDIIEKRILDELIAGSSQKKK